MSVDTFDASRCSVLAVAIELMPPGKRARKAISRSGMRRRYKLPSFKAGRMLHCASRLEFDGNMLSDTDPMVTYLQEQAGVIKVSFVQDGNVSEIVTYPDSLIHRLGRKTIIEYKYEEEATSPEIAFRTSLIQAGIPLAGFDYVVLTERDVRDPPAMLENAEFLLHYGRKHVNDMELEIIRRYLTTREYVTAAEIRRGIFGPRGMRNVCNLVLRGHLTFDRTHAWRDITEVRWATAETGPPPID